MGEDFAMQGCVPEKMMIRSLAGELTGSEREQILSHLRVCPDCDGAWKDLSATWELLGQIDAPPPPRDFAGPVLAKAATLEIRGLSSNRAVQIAAVIVLAVGLGIVAGLLAPRRSSYAYLTPAVSDEQVVDALGLDEMIPDTSLFAGVFGTQDVPDDADQEQPS